VLEILVSAKEVQVLEILVSAKEVRVSVSSKEVLA
jgi:hypothetical protein